MRNDMPRLSPEKWRTSLGFKYRSRYESWQRTSVIRNVVPNFPTYFENLHIIL